MTVGLHKAMLDPGVGAAPARHRPRVSRRAAMALVAASLGMAGCSGGTGTPSTSPSGATPATSTVTTATPSGTAPMSPSQTRPSAPATTPGQAQESPFPAGAVLGVVGVAHNDALNVRSGPGTAFPVVATLAPHAYGAVSTGRAWAEVGTPWWGQVTVSGVTGWANLRYLAGRGDTNDVTAEVIQKVGFRPVAATMNDLGLTVAKAKASTDPPSAIVISVAPSVGDLGEVTYDVVGLGDDSTWALRLHVFGQRAGSGGDFTLKSVEETVFCARGAVVSGGLCP